MPPRHLLVKTSASEPCSTGGCRNQEKCAYLKVFQGSLFLELGEDFIVLDWSSKMEGDWTLEGHLHDGETVRGQLQA